MKVNFIENLAENLWEISKFMQKSPHLVPLVSLPNQKTNICCMEFDLSSYSFLKCFNKINEAEPLTFQLLKTQNLRLTLISKLMKAN